MSSTAFNFERFYELTTDLVCIAGYDGYFQKINTAFSKTLGYSFEELYSKPINDFIQPEKQNFLCKKTADKSQRFALF